MYKIAKKILLVSTVTLMPFSSVLATDVFLDKTHQGSGNKGTNFRPVDEFNNPAIFEMTARSIIDDSSPNDPAASGSTGTVVIDKNNGAGVQTSDGSGSKGISGGGGHKDEELIFTYDSSTSINSIIVGLNDIEFGSGTNDKDDPKLWLKSAGSSTFDFLFDDIELASIFSSTGSKSGTIDFSLLAALDPGLAPGALIDGFKIRETNGHLFVNLIGMGTTPPVVVPEPETYALMSSFLVIGAYIRRKKNARAASVA